MKKASIIGVVSLFIAGLFAAGALAYSPVGLGMPDWNSSSPAIHDMRAAIANNDYLAYTTAYDGWINELQQDKLSQSDFNQVSKDYGVMYNNNNLSVTGDNQTGNGQLNTAQMQQVDDAITNSNYHDWMQAYLDAGLNPPFDGRINSLNFDTYAKMQRDYTAGDYADANQLALELELPQVGPDANVYVYAPSQGFISHLPADYPYENDVSRNGLAGV